MEWLGRESASSRRTVVTVLLAAVLCAAAGVQAQEAQQPAPAEQPAPAQQPGPAQGQQPAAGEQTQQNPPDAFKFTTPAALVIWIVKPAAAADFESVWAEVRMKLSASDKPDLKGIGDSIKLYKADGPATADGVTYFMYIDPVAPSGSYNPTWLLYRVGPLRSCRRGSALPEAERGHQPDPAGPDGSGAVASSDPRVTRRRGRDGRRTGRSPTGVASRLPFERSAGVRLPVEGARWRQTARSSRSRPRRTAAGADRADCRAG